MQTNFCIENHYTKGRKLLHIHFGTKTTFNLNLLHGRKAIFDLRCYILVYYLQLIQPSGCHFQVSYSYINLYRMCTSCRLFECKEIIGYKKACYSNRTQVGNTHLTTTVALLFHEQGTHKL